MDDFACSAQVRGRHVEGDDVDGIFAFAAADAEDVLGIRGMPEGGRVAYMCLAGQQQLEGNVLGSRGM